MVSTHGLRDDVRSPLTVLVVSGIAFSPDGLHLYIADTGMAQGFFGTNATSPSTM
jgi:DNA-binding beta-propeller fold protein YncE